MTIEPGSCVRHRLGADLGGGDARDLHRLGPGERAALDGRPGARLGDRRVRDAARLYRRRKQRDATRGRQDGRTVEIQRLIGARCAAWSTSRRSASAPIYLDCDVLQADGGTRCASITGAYVALSLACERLRRRGVLEGSPLTGSVAAVSCGIVAGPRCSTSTTPRTPRPRSTPTS